MRVKPDQGSPLAALSRRQFLVFGTGAGIALGFAGTAFSAMDPARPGSTVGADRPPLLDPNLWFAIDAAGVVTINIVRAEMGQHVGTALARILADELEADWDTVRIVHVDTDPKWGVMVTGGSWSVSQTYPLFSQAGAAGRIALIEAAASHFGVSAAGGTIRRGVVHVGGHQLTFAELAKAKVSLRSFSADEMSALPIKRPDQRRLVGQPVQALDIAPKVNGSARYGFDAKVEGMVFGRPKLPPTRNGASVRSIDDSAAKGIKGYIKSIVLEDPSNTVPGWVVVLADSLWGAHQAADLVKVDWTAGPGADLTDQWLIERGRELVAAEKTGIVLDISDDGAPPLNPHDFLEAEYATATVLHFQLEPLNALAFEKDGVFEIHTGNQWQSLILPTLAKALDRPQESIVMRTYLLGGGFGRRLNGDYAVPAALAAKALGRPVKLIFTREDDARFDSPRSASYQRLRMDFGPNGKILSMQHDACAGWPTKAIGTPDLLTKTKSGGAFDGFAIAGADSWYDLGHKRVRAFENDLANSAFRPGWLRSVGPGWTNWALESFMDEAAHRLGQDPVEFRLKHLTATGINAGGPPKAVGGALRQAEVVRRAAARAGWGKALPADTALGLATSFGQERDMPTWVACAARIRVDRKTGLVKVEKLTMVTDAGTIVDPDGALAQTEGAALWGLSMALHEGTEFAAGMVKDVNLDTYFPLRMADVPDMDISFVESSEPPVGLGEPMTTVIAPAIGNAIFRAIGVRLRKLPIAPGDIVKGLAEMR